ncbi:uncharacterized protein LY89DRAFT_786185 [Mollisia scopiformis]|uniref:Disease resistance R13L4/SHOC-2-like LRR domain-containing protein n=1 Tax=Mollisia scopiformis TaxID=149040 RepID=A0A194WWT0_MOLSC|nr:uncharacterized protein LY89DRAFT_786185 [Mollisia scopiformis]KUJ12042.1 hypothetical protein LY89DRAFT_786185 [Mollisia scopiformis]
MDRPSGPLGAATQSSRPMVENGAPRPAPPNTTGRRVPNNVRHEASSSSLKSKPEPTPIAGQQTISLFQKAMDKAREDHQKTDTQAAKAAGMMISGVTIDFSHKGIMDFPDEVIDIIKEELERLALSHCHIKVFPLRLNECFLLRYLNVRDNGIREFPRPILELKSLEILDISRNKLIVIPDEIAKMTSLKVFSVQKNRLEGLPLCLADMPSLQKLKLHGNPLKFPPQDLLYYSNMSPDGTGMDVEPNDEEDLIITTRVKRYLKQKSEQKATSERKSTNDRSETESGGEESSEGAETPRGPTGPMVKRLPGGRFPVKVNGTEMPDLRSPAFSGPRLPPPIPSRSHYRGLSQQNAALRRPGAVPLTIGNGNERIRSNSASKEGFGIASRDSKDRAAERSRRMGIVSRRAQELELETVDETRSNRHSHYRGLSHGSAMTIGTNGSTRSPASPADSASQRSIWVKRLSSLPERQRESNSSDPIIEGAKSILYALMQIHPFIHDFLGVAGEGPDKRRSSLKMVFYSANAQIAELDKQIKAWCRYTEEDEEIAPRSNEHVHRACVACLTAYMHVCTLLQSNAQTIAATPNSPEIRSFLVNLWGSIIEIRNATLNFPAPSRSFRRIENTTANSEISQNQAMGQSMSKESAREDRARAQNSSQMTSSQSSSARSIALKAPEDKAKTSLDESMRNLSIDERGRAPIQLSTDQIPTVQTRDRSVTPVPLHERPGLYMNPKAKLPDAEYLGQLRMETSSDPQFAVQLRSALLNSTPRSEESFTSNSSDIRTMGGSFTDHDQMFEKIYLTLRDLTKMIEQLMPDMRDRLVIALKLNSKSQNPDMTNETWQIMINQCENALIDAAWLKQRLSQIKLKDPPPRNNEFWRTSYRFIGGVVDLMQGTRSAKQTSTLMPFEVINKLSVIQKAFKRVLHLIHLSPWAPGDNYPNSKTAPYAVNSLVPQVPLPMTPQSAALGPAVQATVPSTPQSATFGGSYSGNGYDRAGTFTSMTDSSVSSRNGTMTAASAFMRENDGSATPVTARSTDGYSNGLRTTHYQGNSGFVNYNGNSSGMSDGTMHPSSVISPATPSVPNTSFSRNYFGSNGNGSNVYNSRPNN